MRLHVSSIIIQLYSEFATDDDIKSSNVVVAPINAKLEVANGVVNCVHLKDIII